MPSASYPLALGLTVLVEVPVYVAAITVSCQVRWYRTAVAGVLVNLVTHPLLWWFLRQVPAHGYWWGFAVGETAVCAAEGWMVARVLRLRGVVPYAAAVAANAASVLAGLLLLG